MYHSGYTQVDTSGYMYIRIYIRIRTRILIHVICNDVTHPPKFDDPPGSRRTVRASRYPVRTLSAATKYAMTNVPTAANTCSTPRET
jgi:hypothetical protein